MMNNEDAIKAEFKSKQLNYLDAIERLQLIGLHPTDAERRVYEWEDEIQRGKK